MDLLEIAMLVLGIIVIIISCLKFTSSDNENNITYNNNIIDDKKYLERLSSASEEIISNAEDHLSKLSNEKIMAVDEFSEQILEKINRNHEEVIFLYNMLTSKEKELKEVIKDFNDVQRRAKEFIAKNQTEQEKKSNSPVNAQLSESIGNANINESDDQPISHSNEEILNLYSQGKSVLEISKQLGIGQGEVKLVIDLFKANK